MADLNGKERRRLRALGHHLEPTIHVGQAGVHDTLMAATDAELGVHELVKVRMGTNCLEDKDDVAKTLAEGTGAHVIQVIGHTILLYRQRPEEKEE